MKNKIKLFVVLICLVFGSVGCAKSPASACETVTRMGLAGCVVTNSNRFTPSFSGCHRDDSVAYTGSCTIRN